MSETNENPNQGASEETTSTTVQAEGAETNQGQGTELILGKFKSQEDLIKSYQELEKLASKKGVNADALDNLGLKGATKAEVSQAVDDMTTKQAQQTARQVFGSQWDAWLAENRQKFGEGLTMETFVKHLIKETIGDHLSPVNQQLEVTRQSMNEQAIELAAERLARDYPDYDDYADGFKAYWEANPSDLKALQSAKTTKEEKFRILEYAYFKAAHQKARNSTAAAKAAGAVDSKQREQMKASSVTSGSTKTQTNDDDPVAAYKARLVSGGRTKNSTLL